MYSNRRRDTPKAAAPSEVELIKLNIVHELDEEALEKLYMWVDEIPLSRPKKNMARDFSDGVLMAEILKFKLKTGVDLHNYPACNNVTAKQANWNMMNRKVLSKMDLELSDDLVKAICTCKPHVIESVLSLIRDKIDHYLARQLQKQRAQPPRRQRYDTTADMLPEADQNSRGYVPSAEGFYQDGQFQSPTTRRLYPDYTVTDPLGYHSTPGRSQPASSHMAAVANGEMLPKGLLDEREVAIENREQTISMLTAKIQRLEQLLQLKDMRIEDLSNKLDQLTAPIFQQPAQRGQRGAGMSNRLSNQGRHGGSQQLASHSGRY